MRKIHLLSVSLSLLMHVPLVYGFQFSFAYNAARPPEKSQQTYVSYYPKKESPSRPISVIKNPPLQGFQTRTPDEAMAGSQKKERRKKIKKTVNVAKQIKKDPKQPKVKKKMFLPTAENVQLENPVIKKIFFQYYDFVRKIIKDHTLYPYQAKMASLEGTSYLSFVLEDSGDVRKIVLLDSSGFATLDDAAVASIRNSEPFPPFPNSLGTSEIKLNVPITFELE